MKLVTELYNTHLGQDIYILGTGTSARVFPLGFLDNKITIGLNLAWQIRPVTYCITMRPDLNIPEIINWPQKINTTWITKREKLQVEQKPYGDENFYYFETKGQKNTAADGEPSNQGRMPQWVEKPSGEFLYLWSSISQSAINLAANMGAKNIFLVGCDNSAIGGNHHAQKQHTFWKGASPEHRYHQYYEGLVEVRRALRKRDINLISMTPFVGLSFLDEDLQELCSEMQVPKYIHNEDISWKMKDTFVLNKLRKLYRNLKSLYSS